jgi:uncharacterized tellurite resistance protein B-like protein
LDVSTFFDIYIRSHTRTPIKRDGIEFRYAAATLLIACSRSDMDEDPKEKEVIQKILTETFNVSERTIGQLLEFAETAGEEEYLGGITNLINEQFSVRDKHFLLEKLWLVAYADGRIEKQEQDFIERVANDIDMQQKDIEIARTLAQQQITEIAAHG